MRVRPVLLSVTLLLFVAVFLGFVIADRSGARPPLQILLLPAPAGTPDISEAQISGLVRNPGAYPITRTERVADLVAAAGGLLPGADVERVNEAQRVSDGEHILIPARATPNAGPILVRINHASQAELATLPGVNLSQAAAITASVRRQGALQSADDLVARKLMSAEQAGQLTQLVDWSP